MTALGMSLCVLYPKAARRGTYTCGMCVYVCHTQGLSGGVVHMQVKGPRAASLYHRYVAPCPLVSLSQSISAPVCPVDVAAIQSDSKRMGNVLMAS